jgi:multimeric flavodoxin WrbA
MTIVAVISTPRQEGNSAIIVNEMVKAARAKGKDVVVYDIARMNNVEGCIACMKCKTEHRCVLEDDFTEVLDAIRNSEGVILSTPCYFNGPCGQLKLLIDRFYGFMDDDRLNIEPGKKASVVVTCGSDLENAKMLQGRIENIMKKLGFNNAGGLVYFKGNVQGSVLEVGDVLNLAKQISESF